MIWVRKGDWRKEYSLVMLDEYEYRIEFPVGGGEESKYKISIVGNSLLAGLTFERKFSRLPKEFKRAALLIQVFYTSGGFETSGFLEAGWFVSFSRSGDWKEIDWETATPPKITTHGPSFYLTFKTGKYPETNKYPTKIEYQQMKRKK